MGLPYFRTMMEVNDWPTGSGLTYGSLSSSFAYTGTKSYKAPSTSATNEFDFIYLGFPTEVMSWRFALYVDKLGVYDGSIEQQYLPGVGLENGEGLHFPVVYHWSDDAFYVSDNSGAAALAVSHGAWHIVEWQFVRKASGADAYFRIDGGVVSSYLGNVGLLGNLASPFGRSYFGLATDGGVAGTITTFATYIDSVEFFAGVGFLGGRGPGLVAPASFRGADGIRVAEQRWK